MAGFFARFYPGPVAARCLWQWAGGDESEIEYNESPDELWKGMIEKAESGDSEATPLSLLREALFDRPGDENLLVSAERIAEKRFPEGLEAALILPDMFKRIAPEFNAEQTWIILQSLPCQDEKTTDEYFAATAPVFEGRFKGDGAQGKRGSLEKILETLAHDFEPPALKEAADTIVLVMKSLSSITKAAGVPEVESAANALKDLFRDLPENPEDFKAGAIPLLERFGAAASHSGDSKLKAAFQAVSNQAACLERIISGERPPDIKKAATACIHALWATKGEE